MTTQYTPVDLRRIAERVHKLYPGRQDYHGEYAGIREPDVNGKRKPIDPYYPGGPLTVELLEQHLTTGPFAGVSALLENDMVYVGVVEHDRHSNEVVEKTATLVRQLGIPGVVSRSKSNGPHVEFFFDGITNELWERFANVVKHKLGWPLNTEHYPHPPSKDEKKVMWWCLPYANGGRWNTKVVVSERDEKPCYDLELEAALDRMEGAIINATTVKAFISLNEAVEADKKASKKKTQRGETNNRAPNPSWARSRLTFRVNDVLDAHVGERNPRLNKASYEMGGWVGGNSLTADDARAALREAVDKVFTTATERQEEYGTIERGLEEGAEEPLYWGGNKKESTEYIRAGLRMLDVRLSYNEFKNELVTDGLNIAGMGFDRLVRTIRYTLDDIYGTVPGKENTAEFLKFIGEKNGFHPVREYYDSLVWDGKPRIGRLFIDYMGADDTPLNQDMGLRFMLAGVRRIKQGGVPFDIVPILEGAQGIGKSTALKILASRPEWFTDNVNFLMDTGRIIEATKGKRMVEIPELSGMGERNMEHIKGMISRTTDTWRLAYEQATSEIPRQFILAMTTNSKSYFRDTTGNRRFVPILTTLIHLDELKRDVDQLWAEAVVEEAREDVSITLSPTVWAAAAEAQEQRMEEDPWLSILEPINQFLTGKIRTKHLWAMLDIPNAVKSPSLGARLRKLMEDKLGWEKTRLHFTQGELQEPAYVKGGQKDAKGKYIGSLVPTLSCQWNEATHMKEFTVSDVNEDRVMFTQEDLEDTRH